MLVSPERFEEMVADAIDSIPPVLADRMDNVAIVVEDWPSPEQLGSVGIDEEAPSSRRRLLGLFTGVPLTGRTFNSALRGPDLITIFRGPLCAAATDEADLARRVRTTVLHEVGHHFGISDARLRELGW